MNFFCERKYIHQNHNAVGMDLFDNELEEQLRKAAESLELDFKCIESHDSLVETMTRVLSGMYFFLETF